MGETCGRAVSAGSGDPPDPVLPRIMKRLLGSGGEGNGLKSGERALSTLRRNLSINARS